MARQTHTLEGVEYPTLKAFEAAYKAEMSDLDVDAWYEADDLIRDIIRVSRWIPTEWADWVVKYKVTSGEDDAMFPDRKAEMRVIWIKLDDGVRVRLGWGGIMATKHGAFSSWMREVVKKQSWALHAEQRKERGYRCAYDGAWHTGVSDLQADHATEFNVLLLDFACEYTGNPDATLDDLDFAHPDDEEIISRAFWKYHHEHAILQPMCAAHNAQKEADRRAARSLATIG